MKYLIFIIFLNFFVKGTSQICGLTSCDLPISTCEPDYGNWDPSYTWSATLYDAAQIGGAMNITDISVRIDNIAYNSSFTLQGQKIWLKMTNASSYGSCSFPGTAGFTQVFNGTIIYQQGYINIHLSTSFNYNNVSKNLELLWENTNTGDISVLDARFDRLDASASYVGKWGGSDFNYNNAKTHCSRVYYTQAIGFNTINNVNCNLLPIELLEFGAENNNGNIDLFWSTATEINNDFFTIEHSLNGVDFSNIFQINGSGNSNTEKRYSVTDLHATIGNNYYRLKQTDFNGDYSYSKIVTIKKNISFDFDVYLINKKLFIKKINIKKITIINSIGNIVYRSNKENNIIDVSFIQKGLYFVKINNEEPIKISF